MLLTVEAMELTELSEDADGLAALALALAGVVEGEPILVTLCTGANRPYLFWHWKYL